MATKNFNIMENIGKCRYVINFHDGAMTHRDGSPFYGIRIVSNKRALNREVKALKADGYVETETVRYDKQSPEEIPMSPWGGSKGIFKEKENA